MAKYFKGAEDRPLKAPNTELPIVVYLRDLSKTDDEDDVVAEFKLDYANYYDRKKIGRITYWAMTNNHYVETISVKDAEPEVKK
jgi:hypothetical protein